LFYFENFFFKINTIKNKRLIIVDLPNHNTFFIIKSI
jgi:hypothetical protein